MSGWLDIIEDEINCPHCGKLITIQFCEEGDPNRYPVVVIGLAGEVNCPTCKQMITDEDIENQEGKFS